MNNVSNMEKIKRLITGERVVESIQITQSFPLYGLLPETYAIDFVDNWFGLRSMKINGSAYCVDRQLWVGTELYVLTIAPWMKGEISNEGLKSHIDILKGLSDSFIHQIDKKNVVQFNKFIKKKKKPTRKL